MSVQEHITTNNIFEDLGFNKAEAINLKVRSNLMLAVRDYIEKNQLSQKEAARKLGIDQPQISRLLQGKIGNFTIDKLIIMLSRVGIKVSVKIAA